tara:strand:- start:1651 stop:2496 length:846 start_codon:yes stop_codon:yes gene_type:complete
MNRKTKNKFFKILCFSASISSIVVLALLLYNVVSVGLPHLSFDFLSSFPSRFAEKAGIKSALFGSIWLLIFITIISVPVGVAAAIYLEEYSPKNKWTKFIEINISNLAGVPSIVYGILGLVIFVRFFHLERSILAGSFTMSILILPVIIITAREAIKAVPKNIRLGAYALGASKWQTVKHHVLPIATPGIMTGVILAISRAIGETAPLIMMGAFTYVAFVPSSIWDEFTTLPIQIYNWTSRPQAEFHEIASAGIIVLLVVLLTMNAAAIIIRKRANKKYDW